MASLIAYKANALIEAQYQLSLQEQRVLLVCIGKLKAFNQNPSNTVTISAKELFCHFPDIGFKNAEIILRETVDKLWNRTIVLNGETLERKFRWIQEQITYVDGSGETIVKFSESIMPYLMQLKEQFTKITLRNISTLTKTHSIRLYELLMQFSRVGHRVITVEEFRRCLELDTKYLEFKRLQEKVIAPSVAELNKKTNLKVSILCVKKGRKVVAMHFFFSEKDDTGCSDLT